MDFSLTYYLQLNGQLLSLVQSIVLGIESRLLPRNRIPMQSAFAACSVEQFDSMHKGFFRYSFILGFNCGLEFLNRSTYLALCLSVSQSSSYILAFSFRR